MKRIIYQDYGKKGSEDATIAIYRLSLAIDKDMALQGRDFKPHTYNNWIRDQMNPSNKTGFKNGIRMGKILVDGDAWESSNGKTKGEDLARAIVFTLRNEGVYEWLNVRKCVEAMPAPFNKLSTIQYDPQDAGQDLIKSGLAEIGASDSAVEARELLIKFTGVFDRFILEQNQVKRLKKIESLKNVNMANDIRELSEANRELKNQLISRITEEKRRLESLRPSIVGKKDMNELESAIALAEKQLKKLQTE